MKKLFSLVLAVLAVCAVASGAQAATIYNFGSGYTLSTATLATGGVEANWGTPGSGWTSPNASKVVKANANIEGSYVLSYDKVGSNFVVGSNPGTYLAVLDGGSATYSYTTPINSLSFDWGTVDSYNTLTLWADAAHTIGYQLTGADLIANATFSSLGLTAQKSPVNIALTTAFEIYGITFESSLKSFEFKGLQVAQVPLPAALGLFGAAVAGTAAMRRRKKTS